MICKLNLKWGFVVRYTHMVSHQSPVTLNLWILSPVVEIGNFNCLLCFAAISWFLQQITVSSACSHCGGWLREFGLCVTSYLYPSETQSLGWPHQVFLVMQMNIKHKYDWQYNSEKYFFNENLFYPSIIWHQVMVGSKILWMKSQEYKH